MKQLARYKINFESKWLVASTALMGLAIFCQALLFFVFRMPQSVSGGTLTLYMILPMVLELGWIILLHSVKLNAPGIYGLIGCAFAVLLTVQICGTAGAGYIVLAILGYLVACGGFVMITGGFFPYKYFAMAYLALLLLVRFFRSGLIDLLRGGKWEEVAAALPGLCILTALSCFFGGISGVRCKR